MHEKRGDGTVPAWLVTTIILVLVFISILLVLRPLLSPQFTLNAKEQVCRQTIQLSETASVLGWKPLKPLCSTQIIPFTEKDILKRAKKNVQAKDAAAYQVLEYMQRCKDIVNGPKRKNFLSGKSCYICYSLRADATTPYLSTEDMVSYAFLYREPNGERFFFELQKDDHAIITYLPDGLGQKSETTPSQQKGIARTKHSAIAYASFDKGSVTNILGAAGTICGGTLAGAAYLWFIPVVNVAAFKFVALPVCAFSIGTGGIIALFEQFFNIQEDGQGAILLTDYASLDNYGCGTVVS